MGLREAALKAYRDEQAAIEAERLADAQKQADIDEQRREQRRRAAEKVLAELFVEADVELTDASLTFIAHSYEHEWLPAHSVALEYDGLLFVWHDRTSLRVELPGAEWSTAAGPGTLRLYTRCEGCRWPIASTMVVNLSSIGEFLEQPAIAAHAVHIDDDPDLPTVLCTATAQQIAEARACALEADAARERSHFLGVDTDARSERRYITTNERRAVDLLLELRSVVFDIDGERQPF